MENSEVSSQKWMQMWSNYRNASKIHFTTLNKVEQEGEEIKSPSNQTKNIYKLLNEPDWIDDLASHLPLVHCHTIPADTESLVKKGCAIIIQEKLLSLSVLTPLYYQNAVFQTEAAPRITEFYPIPRVTQKA